VLKNGVNTPKIKVVPFDELYNFHFGYPSKFQIDFELGIQIEKGTISRNLYFQNYFEFCIETSKAQNTKVVHLDKIYNFVVELITKFCLVFKLHKRG